MNSNIPIYFFAVFGLVSNIHSDAHTHKTSCLITKNSIDKLKLGMQYKDIQKNYPKATIQEHLGVENTEFVMVYLYKPVDVYDQNYLLSVSFDTSTSDSVNSSSNEKRKINFLSTRSANCKTTAGISPHDSLTKAIKAYGGLKYIYVSGSEGREYAYFKHGPKSIGFEITQGSALSVKNSRAKRYHPDARIREITVSTMLSK